MIDLQKLEVANNVLSLIEKGIWLSVKGSYLQINWKHWKTEKVTTKRWMCGGNFYPPYTLPTGGTHTVAIACLAQWIRGQKCYPLTTWKYWCGKTVGMTPANIPDILEAGGYPVEQACGFCGKEIAGSWDWYFDVGMGCRHRQQCENYKGDAIAHVHKPTPNK